MVPAGPSRSWALVSTPRTLPTCSIFPRQQFVHANLSLSLVPNPDNPHDPMAISVRNNGKLLGYLSREDALRYGPEAHRLATSGYAREVQEYLFRQSTQSQNWYPSTEIHFVLPEPGHGLP
ncbi:hypothetical protein DCC26_03690 [Auritidibacter sp. NML120779]|nr:hypothetical protein DCC26_03690 [Auritidibacter sp. NML120779]